MGEYSLPDRKTGRWWVWGIVVSLFVCCAEIWQQLHPFPKAIGPIMLLSPVTVEVSSFWLQNPLFLHLKPGFLLLPLTWCLVIFVCLPNHTPTLIKVTSISVFYECFQCLLSFWDSDWWCLHIIFNCFLYFITYTPM